MADSYLRAEDKPSVAISYDEYEWWTKHLAAALSRISKVELVLMAKGSQPGYCEDADLCDLLRRFRSENAFYIGSFAKLFRGLTSLPLRTAIWADFPPSDNYYLEGLALYDHVFASSRRSMERLSTLGFSSVSYLPFAVDDTLLCEPYLDRIYDVAFVGNLDLPATREKRLSFLTSLERRFKMNDFRTPVHGRAMMEIYSRAKIVINIPVPDSGCFNMRAFEAMGAGALMLTQDVGTGSHDLFRAGEHLDYYVDDGDLTRKIERYLKDCGERQRIAQAGREEVLAKHTYKHRAETVLETMSALPLPLVPRPVGDRPLRVAYAKFYSWCRRIDLLSIEGGRSGTLVFKVARKLLYLLATRRYRPPSKD